MLDNSIVITTERCILTKLCEADINEAIKLFTNDRVRLYLGGTITDVQARDKLNGWIKSRNDLYFTVRISETGEFIGIVSVSKHHDNEVKELSYQLLPEYWGNGLAFEALKAFLGYLGRLRVYDTLIAETQTQNVKSCNLLSRLGFELVCTLFRFDEEQSIYRMNF